jgi:formiminotetrahydrofolate cyclodeaminase
MVVRQGVGTQEARPFLERVASTDPVPGGGSVAAVMCALAGTLAEMVARITASKPKYDDVRPEMEAVARNAERLWVRSLDLAEADSAAYEGFMEALRLPRETEQERESRKRAMSEAADRAAVVPLQICEAALEILDLLRVALSKGLPTAATDVASGAVAAEAALRAASLTALSNLSSIEDAERRLELASACRDLLESGRRISASIEIEVRGQLLGELEE